jgi:hypothetical protein
MLQTIYSLAPLAAIFSLQPSLPHDQLPANLAFPIASYQLAVATPAPKPQPKTIEAVEPKKTVYVPKITPTVYPGVNAHELIYKYASVYGANPQIMVTIAQCESGMRGEALSPSGVYGGMYQFNISTWMSNRRAMNLDPNPNLRFNPEEAIKTAAFKMGRDGYGAWPACSQKALASK